MSGVLTGRDPATGEMPPALDAQCANVFAHVRALMHAAGGTPDDIIKMTFWLSEYRDRDALNREWTAMFPDAATRPARQVMAAQLDGGSLVQCDLSAILEGELAREGSAPRRSRRRPSTPGRSGRHDVEHRKAVEGAARVVELAHRLADREGLHAALQRVDDGERFEAREALTGASVHAVPERQVVDGVPLDAERVGVVVLAGVAVAGGEERRPAIRRESEFRRPRRRGRASTLRVHERLVPQRLVERRRDERGVVAYERELVGVRPEAAMALPIAPIVVSIPAAR